MEVTPEEMDADISDLGIDPNGQWRGRRPTQAGSTEEEEA
jgi:hypothetical protein